MTRTEIIATIIGVIMAFAGMVFTFSALYVVDSFTMFAAGIASAILGVVLVSSNWINIVTVGKNEEVIIIVK